MDETTLAAWWMGGLLVVSGSITLWVGWLAREGRLTRQNVAGIRTKTTMASDETWNAAHRAGGPWLIAGGAIGLVGGLTDLLVAMTSVDLMFVVTGIAGTALLGLVTVAGVKGQRAAHAAGS